MSTMRIPRLRGKSQIASFLAKLKNGQVKVDPTIGLFIRLDAVDREVAELLIGETIVRDDGVRNRQARPLHIGDLADAMESGTFCPEVGTIKMTKDGELVDAHNRLMGIAAANACVDGMILQILPRDDAIQYIDAGVKPRSTTDTQRLAGDDPLRPSIISAIALEDNNFKPVRLSARQKVELAKSSPFLGLAKKIYKANTGTTSGVLAAAIRCARVDRESTEKWFTALVTGGTECEVDGVHSPAIYHARLRIKAHKQDKIRGFQRMWNDACVSINAFKRWKDGDAGLHHLKNSDYSKGPLPLLKLGMAQWRKQVKVKQREKVRSELRGRVNAAVRVYKQAQMRKIAAPLLDLPSV